MEWISLFKGLLKHDEEPEAISMTVSVKEAGTLSEQISESQASSLVELKLSGNLDSEDLSFIHTRCKRIERLDISDTRLTGGRFVCCKHKNFYNFGTDELAGHTLHIGNLKEVTLPASVSSILISSFADLDFGECSDRSELTRLSGAFGAELENINVPSTNIFYSSYDGILYNKEMTELLKCPLSHKKEVTFPKTLKRISANAFRECRFIESVDIPEGVTSIGEKAFYGCDSLRRLSLPASVTTLDDDVFAHSYKLDTLECSWKNPLPLSLTRSSSVMKCRLIVPAESVQAYSSAPYWSEFKKIIGK